MTEADKCIHCNQILRSPPNCCYTAISDYEEFSFVKDESALIEGALNRRKSLAEKWVESLDD